jgi:hypothetical protein
MPETVRVASPPYSVALQRASGSGSAVSPEAEFIRISAAGIVSAAERSFALFGAKSSVISDILTVSAECQDDPVVEVSSVAVERAIDFIRALPDDVPLPSVAADPDGSIAFDWITTRTRVFSLSVADSERLAFAWLDGTDRGHGVAAFQSAEVPARVIEGIRSVTDGAIASFRSA